MFTVSGGGGSVGGVGLHTPLAAVVKTAVNVGGGVQQASFSVDLDQIPGLITKYEEAREKLVAIQKKAGDLQNVVPPGDDEVSAKLASSLGEMAGSGDGKLGWAVSQAIERLQGQIDQLKAAQQGYQTADENATAQQA